MVMKSLLILPTFLFCYVDSTATFSATLYMVRRQLNHNICTRVSALRARGLRALSRLPTKLLMRAFQEMGQQCKRTVRIINAIFILLR